MLSKEDEEIISQIGKYKYNQMKTMKMTHDEYLKHLKSKQEEIALRKKMGNYKFRKMKDLGLTYEEFQKYEEKQQEEKKLKEKIGYREYNKMKELGLNYKEYKQYIKEQKFKKYEKKREKDKIRYRTIRYVERYCNLEMKCQICNTEEDIEIHHPNYEDYLKINLLCNQHHNKLHNFELVPPTIIDLEKVAVKVPVMKQLEDRIKKNLPKIKEDILKNEFSYKDLKEKYKLESCTIKRYMSKELDGEFLINKLKENGKKSQITSHNSKLNLNNPIAKFKIENNLTFNELQKITQIPIPTLRNIVTGKTDFNKIKSNTKKRLESIGGDLNGNKYVK